MTSPARSERRPTTVTFVLEQHLGHATFASNLRRVVEGAGLVDASWVDVDYGPTDSWWERLPRLPHGLLGPLRGRAQVRAGLADHPSEVAFYNTQVPAVLGGRAVRRRPFVLCTDITPAQYDRMAELYGHRPDGTGPLARLKHAQNRRTFQQAAAVVAWSDWVRGSLVDEYGVDSSAIHVIPPGVDLDRWVPAPRAASSGPLRLLFVGGDFARKGGPLLLEAHRALPPGAATIDVVTKSDVAAGPGITVHRDLSPNDPELIDLFQRSDVFALPSRAEAFGIAAAEAAAAGLPVVAARSGGLADIVADGRTGFLVEPGDVVALAERLRTLIDSPDLRQRMASEARQLAEERFDSRRNAMAIVDLLREVAG